MKIAVASEVYHTLKNVIKEKYGQDATNVGDEGGFAPNIRDAEEGLTLLDKAIKKAGYAGKVKIGIDSAASEFFTNGKYDLDFKNPNDKGTNAIAHILQNQKKWWDYFLKKQENGENGYSSS